MCQTITVRCTDIYRVCWCVFSPRCLQIKAVLLSPTQTDVITSTLSIISPCSPGVSHVFDHSASCALWCEENWGACVLKSVRRRLNFAACLTVRFQTKQIRGKWWLQQSLLNGGVKLEIRPVVPWDTLLIFYLSVEHSETSKDSVCLCQRVSHIVLTSWHTSQMHTHVMEKSDFWKATTWGAIITGNYTCMWHRWQLLSCSRSSITSRELL